MGTEDIAIPLFCSYVPYEKVTEGKAAPAQRKAATWSDLAGPGAMVLKNRCKTAVVGPCS